MPGGTTELPHHLHLPPTHLAPTAGLASVQGQGMCTPIVPSTAWDRAPFNIFCTQSPPRKKLNKRRFSASSHRDCLVFLFAAVNSLQLSIGIIVLPASWRMWHVAVRRFTISEDKETYFSPKFDPRPPVSQLSKQILYSWFPAGEQPRSGTHAFIFPSACLSALPIRVTERELFSTKQPALHTFWSLRLNVQRATKKSP